jgi:hypothetical protein
MANTYTWVVEALDCAPSAEGQTNVVNTIHWRVNGTDGTNNATVYGTQGVTYTAGSPFTAYASLTQTQVIGWLQTAMGTEKVAELQANLDAQIALLVTPTVVTPALPWVTT